MSDKIELNEDGTATCAVCNKNQPPAGFIYAVVRSQTFWEPAEWGQICKECQDREEADCKAQQEQEADDDFFDYEWPLIR